MGKEVSKELKKQIYVTILFYQLLFKEYKNVLI